MKAYEKQQKQLASARDAILSSVDRKLTRYLHRDLDVFKWLDTLKSVISIEQSKQVAELAEEYQGFLRAFNCTTRPLFNAWIYYETSHDTLVCLEF